MYTSMPIEGLGSLLSEDIRYKKVYPWSVKPDQLVSHHDLIAWHRDWYAGTEFVGQPGSRLLSNAWA